MKVYALPLLFWICAGISTLAQECSDIVLAENGAAGEIRMSIINAPIIFVKNKTSATDSLCLIKVRIRGNRATQVFERLTIYLNQREAMVFDKPKVEYENINGEHIYSTMVVLKKTQPYELAFYQIATIELGYFQEVVVDRLRTGLQKAAFCTYFNKLPKNI